MIFPAGLSDIPTLARICRQSFPNSVRWQGLPFLARSWWQRVLADASAETWVLRVDDQVVAFCVLVVDEIIWAAQRLHREGGIVARLIAGAASPAAMLRRLRRERSVGDLVALPAATRQMVAPSERVWVELIAVAPYMRGQGLAGRLLVAAEARSRILGRKALGLTVDIDNRAACAVYERAGFVRTSQGQGRCTYTKVLATTSMDGSEND